MKSFIFHPARAGLCQHTTCKTGKSWGSQFQHTHLFKDVINVKTLTARNKAILTDWHLSLFCSVTTWMLFCFSDSPHSVWLLFFKSILGASKYYISFWNKSFLPVFRGLFFLVSACLSEMRLSSMSEYSCLWTKSPCSAVDLHYKLILVFFFFSVLCVDWLSSSLNLVTHLKSP